MMEKTHLFETSVDPRRRQYSVAGVVTSNPAKYSRFGFSHESDVFICMLCAES